MRVAGYGRQTAMTIDDRMLSSGRKERVARAWPSRAANAPDVHG
jgi:hypothetical protein